MDEREALLTAIRATPEEETPRLVFADWLQEHGEDARAEFIRVQASLARTTPADPDWAGLRCREWELLIAHRAEWVLERADAANALSNAWGWGLERLEHSQEIPQDHGFRKALNLWAFQRGFPDTLNLWNVWNSWSAETEQCVAALAECPHLATVASLNLGGNGIWAGLGNLVASPHISNLSALDLGCNRIGDQGAEVLASSLHLTNLTSLNLWENRITDAGVAVLATSPNFANLTALSLGGNQIGDAAAAVLAESMYLGNLTSLSMSSTKVTNAGVKKLQQALPKCKIKW
ncbi:MAG: TIGR02996 domain-containing protein [Planctomycetes bacterium]|nr:TIGR02996 domain-containing protein [Planctomycetota bacterium]